MCILASMDFNAATYSYGDTAIHRTDARVKIALLVAYSVTLFCVQTWAGIAVCLAAFVACAALAHLPLGLCARQLIPLWVILGFTLLVNSFSVNVGNIVVPTGLGAVSAGVFEALDPIILVETFGFVPAGFARGCFYVLRIALLAFASMVLTTTTSSTQLAQALERILSPLARLGVPTRDATTIVSIALRFIPVTFDEFQMVRSAQQSRGAA
ncbi:MAG: energy-coupling factor transporter transmembrane protein EcfT, partial [Eggerthellaceae bacterium]|nr:energy-coupling factor transporter transmembrane protein EcfT [Eggerthellaceae bacterium]